MKKISQNLKKGELKFHIDSLEDLWYLSFIIEAGDSLRARTIRKLKLDTTGERKTTIVKKPITLTLQVERIELTSDSLRISGKITQGPEDISRGSYHTISLEPNSRATVTKQEWLSFQLEKLKEACEAKTPDILLVVHDREEARIAVMKSYGYEMLLHLKGNVARKRIEEKAGKKFYPELLKKIEDYVKRYKITTILLASPAFFKEDLLKIFPSDLKKKVILATCSSVSKNAIDEVLKRDEAKQALAQERASTELKVVEKLLKEISLDGLACYGLKDTKTAAEAGAIQTFLITDKKIQAMREKETFQKADYVMRLADKSKAKVVIISSDLESGKKLDGLTGIAALLRYPLTF